MPATGNSLSEQAFTRLLRWLVRGRARKAHEIDTHYGRAIELRRENRITEARVAFQSALDAAPADWPDRPEIEREAGRLREPRTRDRL